MSTETNRAALERYFEEFWNKGNTAAADDFNEPDCIIHFPYFDIRGVDGVKGYAAALREAFCDMEVVLDKVIAEGDMVAGCWTCRCKHKGEFMGLAPTGKPVTFVGFFTMRFVDGKRAESWELIDNADLMKQIEARTAYFPAPAKSLV
jgi:predicted ester cyclase